MHLLCSLTNRAKEILHLPQADSHVLRCIQFSHAEFRPVYLYYEHAVPLASFRGPAFHDVCNEGRVSKCFII